MFLLDTNLCIRILTTPAPHLQRKFKMHSPDEIALCSIVKSELLYGARHSQQVEANLQLLYLSQPRIPRSGRAFFRR